MQSRRSSFNLNPLPKINWMSEGTILSGLIIICALVAVWLSFPLPHSIIWPTVLLGACLLFMTLIDAHTQRLPDFLTLPLVPAGLLVSVSVFNLEIIDHLLGAAIGGAVFILIRAAYKALRGHEGLGLGDVKLMIAVGAWLGWQGLPSTVLLATLFGLSWTTLLLLLESKPSASERLPFGPFLCLGSWVTWLHGPLVLS